MENRDIDSIRFFAKRFVLLGLICSTAAACASDFQPDAGRAVQDRFANEFIEATRSIPEQTEVAKLETRTTPIRQVSAVETRYSSVYSRSFVWYDASRRRSIRVKIYYPRTVDPTPMPVIVFSHGLGGSIERCSYLGRAWSARGIVTVLLQHPGSDENVWRGKLMIRNELETAYQCNWNGRTRAKDIRFVLDCLERLAASGDRVGQQLDMTRLGVGGYDLGALGSLIVAGQIPPDRGPSLYDSRVKAVLAMSPPVRSCSKNLYPQIYGNIAVPVFFITGTEDNGIIGSTRAFQRRIPFDSMAEAHRYLLVFRGGDHQMYGGRLVSIGFRDDTQFQPAIAKSSSFFWSAYLNHEEQAMEVLRDNRLYSSLGGLATVERRIVPQKTPTGEIPTSNAPLSPEMKEKTPVESEPVLDSRQNREPEKSSQESSRSTSKAEPQDERLKKDREDSAFPVSLFYRRIVQDQQKK